MLGGIWNIPKKMHFEKFCELKCFALTAVLSYCSSLNNILIIDAYGQNSILRFHHLVDFQKSYNL